MPATNPFGISVFERHLDNNGSPSLVGRTLLHNGKTGGESLSPIE